MEPRQPSFYSALRRREREVGTARGSLRVRELGLGAALQFRAVLLGLAAKVPADDDPPARAARIWQLLELGLEGQVGKLELEDLQLALEAILEVNAEPPALAFQRPERGKKPRPAPPASPLDYEGREGAWVVAQLAGTFGWSAQHCLEELTYYQAMCFLQEALVREHEQRRWDYTLSEVGIRKSGDGYVKEPYPDLPWMSGAGIAEKKPHRSLPAKFSPSGVVMDFSEFAKTGKAIEYVIPKAEEAGSEADVNKGSP